MASPVASRPLWQRGILAAVISGILTVIVLAVANAMMSGSVQVPESMSSKTLVDLAAGQAFGAGFMGLIVGTLLALVLHRKPSTSARVPLIFGIGTVLSCASPLATSGISGGTKLTLIVMHLVCGAVAIALLGRRSV